MRSLLVVASILIILAVNINEDCLDFSDDHIDVTVKASTYATLIESITPRGNV